MADMRAALEARWRSPEPGVLQIGEPLCYDQVQALLDGFGLPMALVEMFVDPTEVVVFTLRAGQSQPIVAHIPMSHSMLEHSLATYHREIVQYPLHGRDDQSWQGSILPLLTNVMPYLHETTSLYLVPHGPLRYFPFHCLAMEEDCLIDRFSIAYAPSIDLLNKVTRRVQTRELRQPPRVLVAGNPTLDLDCAESEARNVAKRFGTEPLIGRRATKVAVRSGLADMDLVHVACHSYHNTFTPMESGLLLAGRRVLTAEEIAKSGVQADLVVLSACESGLNTEMQGLPAAFLEAGASAVLATLWLVEDEAIGVFVNDFYTHLYGSTRHRVQAIATALRATMLKVRAERPHPFFWAPFQLMGAWT
jgi:CHAT domain-containing protein